jgi:hypothetical protein
LTVDANNPFDPTHSELYDPASGSWSSAGSTLLQLADSSSHEIGPAILRPDGTVFATGGTSDTAIYNSVTGVWAKGQPFDGLDVADGPAALLPNGNVLVETSPGVFQPGARFFEFNGTSMSAVTGPTSTVNQSSFQGRMLVLPTGQILFTNGTSDVEIYTASGTYQNAWRPTISSAPSSVIPGATSYFLSGTQLNGLSQGAMYGDDAQAATNYPLVRITNNATSHITYAKTHNHSTMGVATGSAVVSTLFDVPAGIETGPSQLEAVANGIPSIAINIQVTGAVDYTGTFEHAGCDTLSGWAADRSRLNTAIVVSIYNNGVLLTSVLANSSRPDVGSLLRDNGLHGFSIATPLVLRDGNSHLVSVRFESSSMNLAASPISLTCAPPPNYAGTLDHAGCDTLAGWAADRTRLNTPITVSLYDNGTLFTSFLANSSRPDVGTFLGDNGLHGFTITTPASLRNGSTHVVSARFESSGTNLASSPVSLSCHNHLDHASFTLPDGSAHSFYLDANRHVIDLLLSSAGVWQKQDLTALTSALLAEPDSALTGLIDNGGNGRVFYVGTNHHVLQLKLDTAGTWTQGDVMLQAGTGNTAVTGSALTSFGAAGSSAVHVLYLDASQHVNDLARTSAGSSGVWSNQDLTALTSAPLASPGSALTGLVDNLGNGRAFYIGTTQHVLQLKLDTINTWTQGDVMVQAGTSKTAAAGSALTSFGAAGASAVHVLYVDASQHVNDLARTSAGSSGVWSNQDLTALTSSPLAVTGSSLTGLVDSIGNGRAFYVGTNQHVLQLKLDPTNTWTQGDVMTQAGTSTTVATGSALTSFGAAGGSAVHVLYLDPIQHINSLARTSADASGVWSNQDVTALTGP